jgi:hypothetical protein
MKMKMRKNKEKEERERERGKNHYRPPRHSFIREVLKLTAEDAKILVSTAKIAKGRERSRFFGVFWRPFAVKINF